MVVLGYRVVELLKTTWSEVWKDNVLGMSAEALLAAYTGSNMIATIASALNRTYGVTDPRPFLKRRLLAIALMVAVGIALTLSTTIILASKSVLRWLVRSVRVEPQAAAVWQVLRFPVSFSACSAA